MAFSLSPRENFLACLNHQPQEFTPGMTDLAMAAFSLPFERGEGGAGIDAFGVRWVSPPSAAGGALPAPGEFLLTDVTKWRDVVKIPDVSGYDWAGAAALEMASIDRDMSVVHIGSANCIYERLATLMGFEGALLAMALEPEATFELLSALTDWKIEMIGYFAKYYQPDTYEFFDDVATERMLFMSPDTYRTLIKPLHTRIATACKEHGIIPIQHTCGKADLLVQDMIDEGCAGWGAVQATNNIAEVIEEHGDEFVLMGGYDSNGAPGMPTASEAEVRAEVRRCMDSYAKFGKGYVFMGSIVLPGTAYDPMFSVDPLNSAIIDEFLKFRAEQEAAA